MPLCRKLSLDVPDEYTRSGSSFYLTLALSFFVQNGFHTVRVYFPCRERSCSSAMLCWMIVLDNQGGCRSLRYSNVLLNGSCAGSYGPDNVSTEHDGNAPTEDYYFSRITFLNAEEWLARLREPR